MRVHFALSRSHGAHPMVEIGEYFGVHYVTVSRAVRVAICRNLRTAPYALRAMVGSNRRVCVGC